MIRGSHILTAGLIVGVVFVGIVLIGGMNYPEAIGFLSAIGVLAWIIERRGKSALKIFVVAIVVVGLAWAWSVGALTT